MWEDPIVKEVREAGVKLAEQCDFDLHKMAEYLRSKQKRNFYFPVFLKFSEQLSTLNDITEYRYLGRKGRGRAARYERIK